MKKYGALFKCLASRAVHIKVVATMDTDSFIMLPRNIARRRNIQIIRIDNGSSQLNQAFTAVNGGEGFGILQTNSKIGSIKSSLRYYKNDKSV